MNRGFDDCLFFTLGFVIPAAFRKVQFDDDTVCILNILFSGLTYYNHTAVTGHGGHFCSAWSSWDNEWQDMNESEDLVEERNALFGEGEQCALDLWDENYEFVNETGI